MSVHLPDHAWTAAPLLTRSHHVVGGLQLWMRRRANSRVPRASATRPPAAPRGIPTSTPVFAKLEPLPLSPPPLPPLGLTALVVGGVFVPLPPDPPDPPDPPEPPDPPVCAKAAATRPNVSSAAIAIPRNNLPPIRTAVSTGTPRCPDAPG